MAIDRVERLRLYEPKDILPMGVRSAGSQTQPLQIEGNSILSLVYVHALSAGTSVSVQYYDSGSGTNLGEFNLVGQHPVLTAPGFTAPNSSRTLITRSTNKASMRWTVSGPGTAHFGVYAFIVPSFAADLDQALKLDGAVADLLNDKGLVAMGYDAGTGELHFLPLDDGAVVTSGASYTSGLRNAGRITEVTINETTWTALPATPLTDRNAMAIQNDTGQEIKLNYDNTVVGYVGVKVPTGGERGYDIKDTIVIYAKSSVNACTVTVEELS